VTKSIYKVEHIAFTFEIIITSLVSRSVPPVKNYIQLCCDNGLGRSIKKIQWDVNHTISAVFRWSECEAEGQSTCSLSGLPLRLRVVGLLPAENIVLKRGRVTEIDEFSAKVMVRTGVTIELAEPDRVRLFDSTRAAEETEHDRNRLSTTTSPEGVHVASLRGDITKLSAFKWWGLGP
jgi:hypothetical protein